MDAEAKLKIIKDGVQEMVTEEELMNLLKQKKTPVSYHGIAPTGPPHIGYYRTISKQMDLIKAGFKHKILIANLHAYLDDRKTPWEEMEIRGEIYKKAFQLLGLDKNVEYVFGTDFELKKEYYLELLKISAMVTVQRGSRAAAEVCRMTDPKISSLIYPLMQSLDCWGLDVDAAYGGIDQRHVYMLTREIFKEVGHKVPIIIMTPLGKSLMGDKKMSASDKTGRLELHASPEDIKKKINSAFCPEKVVEENPILEYIRYFIFPRIKKFNINRPSKFGGDVSYNKYEELEQAYIDGKIHPMDLKNAVTENLIEILKPIRAYHEKNMDMFKTFNK